MKRTFTLFLAAAFLCMSNVMAQVSLKFDRTGTDAASVTVSVVDAEGVAIEGATATLTSNKSFKTTANAITSSILCPDVNGNANASIELEFTVNGLPEGFKFDKVGLHIHALNGGSNYQETGDGKTRQWNVDIDANGSDFSSFDNIDIAAGIAGANKLWETQAEASVVAGDPFVLKLTITSGATNEGCFFGLSEIVLTEEAEEEPVVEVNGASAGNYYLYDETSKTFLSRGDSWGTKAVTDKYGVPFAWDALPLGSLKFLDSGSSLFITDDGQAFTDNESTGWTFEPVNEGTYRLKGTEERYIKRTDNGVLELTTTAEEAVVWTFKTPAERDAIVAAYPAENYAAIIEAAGLSIDASVFVETLGADYAGKDMTSSIGTAKFAGNVGEWTWTQVRAQWWGPAAPAYGTDFAEVFEITGSFSQQVTDLPSGVYKLTVNGFHRQGGYAKCNELNDAGFQLSTATLEGNGQAVALKPWVTERTGESNPNNTGEAVTAFNAGKYNNEVYVYVAEDGILDISVNIKNHVGGAWVLFNNFTLTYYTDQVSEEDANTVIAKAEGLTGKMEASVAEALASALAAFKASATIVNYNALSAAISAAENSIAVYASAAGYFPKIAGALENTNVYTQEAYKAYYGDWLADYEAGTLATATAATLTANSAYSSGHRSANYVDDILLSTWTIGGAQAHDFEQDLYINTWSTEGDNDGSDFKVPFFEYYGDDANSLATETMTATMTGLVPDGFYSVEAWVRVSAKTNVAAADATGITLSVGEGTPVDVTEGVAIDGSRRSHGVFTAYGYADAEGNLTINFNVLDGNNVSWLSFKNLKYAEAVAATEEQKQALSEAIAKAEANILGFAVGEYAPYTNVDALKALAAAKAVDVDNTLADDVDVVLQALEAAVWTANTTEMNAIYDGSFEYAYSTDGNVQPIAWHGINNHDNATDIRYMWDAAKDAGLLATSTGKALFTKYNAFYGTETGYTMPLKENSVYELTFIYGGWSDCKKDGYVTITGPDDAVIALSADRLPLDAVDGYQNAASWKTYTATFTTGAAGNYVLGLRKDDESKQSQYVYGDFNLRYVGAAPVVEVEEITITTEDGEYYAEFSEAAGRGTIGNTIQLVATVTPDDATDKTVVWDCDAPEDVITVDQNGVVTLVGYSAALMTYNITAKATNGVEGTFELNVYVPEPAQPGAVTSIELNHTYYQLEGSKGTTLQLTATVNEDATDKTITWSSDNEELVTVDPVTGVVTIAATTAENEPAIITATASNGFTAMCYLYVSAYEEGAVRYIDLAIKDGARNQLIGLGATVTLEATIDPVDATDQTLQWSSSEPDCVTVSQEGVVEVIAPFQGGVFIYATASNGVEGSIYLLVQAYEAGGVQQITLNTGFETLNNATTYQLVATITPNDDTVTEENKVLTWESDKTEIATVDQTGKVTFVGTGWVTITVTAKSGASAECGFNVKSLASTDIKAIETLENAVIYDLSGRRVEKAVKGLYIVNGRKVLVK